MLLVWLSHPVMLEHLGHTLLLQECHPINRAAEGASGGSCACQRLCNWQLPSTVTLHLADRYWRRVILIFSFKISKFILYKIWPKEGRGGGGSVHTSTNGWSHIWSCQSFQQVLFSFSFFSAFWKTTVINSFIQFSRNTCFNVVAQIAGDHRTDKEMLYEFHAIPMTD